MFYSLLVLFVVVVGLYFYNNPEALKDFKSWLVIALGGAVGWLASNGVDLGALWPF